MYRPDGKTEFRLILLKAILFSLYKISANKFHSCRTEEEFPKFAVH